MKQPADFTPDERAEMAASLRNSANRHRKMAEFKHLTRKQAKAYLDHAARQDREADDWAPRTEAV